MSDQQSPETKNSDAPGDQDEAMQRQAPTQVDGLAEKAEEETEQDKGGYDH